MADNRNALAELAKRLRNGLYINPSDKRFDGPVIVRTLDANDILAARRIVAELANRNIGLIPQDCYGCGVLKTLANCRVIAGEACSIVCESAEGGAK